MAYQINERQAQILKVQHCLNAARKTVFEVQIRAMKSRFLLRYRHIPVAQYLTVSRQSRALARSLNLLLADGLSWRPPQNLPFSDLRITFLICTVGFTIPMLFDEKKMPYHLMLQYFVSTGAHDALFDCFKWVVGLQKGESVLTETKSNEDELSGSVDDFLEALFTLIERLVNPRNILNSPHMINYKKGDDVINAPFSPIKFLIKTQKAALNALTLLLQSDRLSDLSVRIFDILILILCHVIRGEEIARNKLQEEIEEEKKKKKQQETLNSPSFSEYYFDGVNMQTTSTTTARSRNETSQPTTTLATSLATHLSPSVATTSATEQSSSNTEPDPTIVQNLMDMGFPRDSVFEALGHFPTLEGATEWLLTVSSEEDRLIRAITMSLDDAEGAEGANNEVEFAESENLEELGWASDSTLDLTSNVENNETETKEEPKLPELSLEEIDKKMKEEKQKKEDVEEIKLLNQGDVQPIAVEVIDKFTEEIFTKCTDWVEKLPDTVYRVCDVTLVLMKRDGKEWADKVILKLLDQIKTSCQNLNSKYEANDSEVWLNDDKIAEGLATKAILVALLFEEMRESCCKFVSKSEILKVFITLLIKASVWLKNNKEKVIGVSTPEWISPILLLIDLYERTCISILRRNKMKSQFSGYKREWKWFDDRSGRWCNYSVSNHKSIDDAYNQGLPTVRFTAGRRKYSINFHQLIQCNEESGNRRPIMATYTDNLTTTKPPQEEKMETESSAPTVQSKPMSTKSNQSTLTPSQSNQNDIAKNVPEFTDFTRVDESQANILVHACTEFVCFPVDADTLHSSMRLLLRLTRSGTPGGHERALLYASLGGAGGLLKLKKKHGFTGLTSLATLLLRHVLEDEETLRATMEKTICSVAGTGAANASCGVSGNSLGNRELHYMLRALAPAACQHPQMFTEMCSKNLRIILPPEVGSRDIDAEETALIEPNAVQFIKPLSSPSLPPTVLKPTQVVEEVMKKLLCALIAVSTDQEKNDEDTTATAKEITTDEDTTATAKEITTSKNESKPVSENSEKKQSATVPNPEGLLVTKSSILRLLAELVRSYNSCAFLLTNHRYTPDMSPLIQQECSCLSFILDNPLIPRSKDGKVTKDEKEDPWDDDCPALSCVLLSCLAVSQTQPVWPPNSDPHCILVTELKSALNRAMNGPECTEKHNRLKCLLEIISTIIDCTSKNPDQRNRRLIGRYVKQDSPDYQSGYVPKLMMRKGLATDLAKLSHFIDLGLAGVADTINTALRPLEILTRPISFSLIPKNPHGAKKDDNPTTIQENLQNVESVSNNQEEFVLDMLVAMVNRNQSGEEEDNDNNGGNDGEGRDSPESDLQYLDASEDQPPDEEEEEVFMETMEDASQEPNDDVPVGEDEQEDLDEHLVSLIADSETIDGSHPIDLNNLTRDMSSDDEDADDDDDDDDDDEEDHEDEGSEMNNEDMEDGDDPEQSYEDLNYDTFVYDLIQGDQSDNDLFIRLENIFGGGVPSNRLPQQLLSNDINYVRRIRHPASPGHQENSNQTFQGNRSIPPPPGTVATCHPLLARHANHQQVTDSNPTTPATRTYSQAASGTGPPDGWSHRVMRNNGLSGTNIPQRQGASTQESANHTIHLHYTGNAQPRSAPMVLQRLLGPSVAQDILQISNSLYNEGGGRAQVVVNADDITHNSDDIIDGMFLDNMFQYGVISPQSSSNVPDNVPSSLARWVEESCVLDGPSLYDCLSLIKGDIVSHILKTRDSEIEERKKKRKEEKKVKEEEEEKKKKEKKEKETEPSEPLPVIFTPPFLQQTTKNSSPNISTPSNTPVATRPDSPSHNNQRIEAISNLQQARSSLLAVSGQLEGLSVTLEQSNQPESSPALVEENANQHIVDNVASLPEDEPKEVEEQNNDEDEEERESTPTNMDTASPQPTPDVDATNMDPGNNATEVEMQDSNVEADPLIDPTTSDTANPQIMEGVDPSFLAALPADIRQEVIREQLSRSHHLRPPVTTSSSNQSRSGVSPEFLAALPPNIQEEVLEQERRERLRNTQPVSTEDSDPNTFIQTLPTELRQSVLSDMDESLIAVLSEELAAEAQSLRGDAEERQRRYIQERILSHGVNLLRTGGGPTRIRTHDHENNGWGGFFRRRPGFNNRNPTEQQPTTNPIPQQILDHESLSCLLILLFVEEARMNTASLHRVLRNLCYHPPTREWLIATLMSVIQRAGDIINHKGESHGEAVEMNNKNSSWMSIRLEPALGTRSTIFQLYLTPNIPTPRKTQKMTEQKKLIFIHQQAAPLVCRHAIDALIMLAKVFPNYFVSLESAKLSKGGEVETDFWDILLTLDFGGFQKKKLSLKQSHSNDDDSSKPTSDLGMTWLGCLMRMLGHPVVKRSQQLTDRMLRLLAQISRSISTSQSHFKRGDSNKVGEQSNTTTTESTESSSVSNTQNQLSEPVETSADTTNTATMSARAGTSNTSTVTAHHAAPLTSTTSSTGYHGLISTTTEVSKRAKKMEVELSLAVGVLTSHACSEEGLEDATSLLLQLSKSSSALRLLIINLLLDGAQKLGLQLGDQIQVLLGEIMAYNLKKSESRTSQPPSTSRGVIANRFDSTLSVVLSAKEKFKRLGHELQLPSMQVLTRKTSHQAFFLRILKVIIQLQNSSKNSSLNLISDRGSNSLSNWQTNRGLIGRVRDTVSQLEREASVLRDLIQPRLGGQRSTNNTTTSGESVSSDSGGQSEPKKEETRLSERLQLDELWEVLGECLKELSKSHDQHAVLVLQSAVESFFLVHATDTSRTQNNHQSDQESRESLLSHINEQPPVSPAQPIDGSGGLSSQSSLIDASMPLDMQKFLRFAETHRTVLNQILRQSTIPLSEGPFSVLVDHTRVLDFDVKRRYFRQELERTEESASRRDDVAIRVRRDHLFEDSFRELHRRPPTELRSRLYVVFEGEDGQDAGGVLREWYLVISREIFNPMYALFRTSPGDHGTYTINPLSYINSNHLSYFKFVGRIVAKAIYDNKLLECYFTRSFYKHILGKAVKYTDMEADDYEFSRSLKYMLEHDISSLGTELYFSVEIEEFGKNEVRDLKENGRNLLVSERNKREYVHLVCQEKMTGAIKKQLGAFLEGFYEIIPKRLISIFDEQELELLISGLPTVDIDDLRQNTEYHKYQQSSLQIQWFWRALRSFDQAERAKFLQFVTGTSKVPLLGFSALEGMTGVQKFQIHRDDRSTARLPCAHTCFNQLDLPAYETYDKLRARLLLAISECTEGFGLA